MKNKLFNKTLGIVVISVLLLISSLTIVFATGLLEQQGNSLILLKAQASGSKNVKLTWQTNLKAESYTVYGAIYGNKFKQIATTKNKKILVKAINKKKLKAHKVYKFYVKADAIKSNNCTVIAGLTFGKNGKFSNPKSVSNTIENSTITLKPGEEFELSKLGLITKIYKGKKHLGKKYGEKYSYVISDNTVASIEGNKIKVPATLDKDSTAILYVQEINGIFTKIKINVIADKEPSSDSTQENNNGGNNHGGNHGREESQDDSGATNYEDVVNKDGGNNLPIIFK